MRVGLLPTCLADFFRPSVALAAADLLEAAGCTVVVGDAVCCGQPAYNSGDRASARRVARLALEVGRNVDFLVVPSGSCAGMLRRHAEALVDDEHRAGAADVARRTWELSAFLLEHTDWRGPLKGVRCDAVATIHDSCASLREVQVREQPRILLRSVPGLRLKELEDSRICCGFGGTFCVKYPDISTRMVDNKVAAITKTEASMVVSADLGCLLNIAGRLSRLGRPVRAYHYAEVLAGYADGGAGICDGSGSPP